MLHTSLHAVSYTHLDVYKRQLYGGCNEDIEALNCRRKRKELIGHNTKT